MGNLQGRRELFVQGRNYAHLRRNKILEEMHGNYIHLSLCNIFILLKKSTAKIYWESWGNKQRWGRQEMSKLGE